MGTVDRRKFPGGSQDKGLNNFNSAIDSEISWAEGTVNVSGGIRRGVSPRNGMAPLAGHSNTESLASNQTNGIQKSETTSGSDGLTHRQAIYGIVPITMAPYDGSYPKANQQFYAYLVGLTYSSDLSIDVCLGATLASSVNKQASTLVAGLAQSSYRQESPLVRLHKTELLNLPIFSSTPTAASMQEILKQVPNRWYMSHSHISVAGKRIPYQWMLGKTTSTPDAGTSPAINIWSVQFTGGVNPTINLGSPSEIITREFVANDQRLLTMYCLDSTGSPLDMSYSATILANQTAAVSAYGSGNAYSAASATKSGASVAYASVSAVILNDPGSFTNSRHEAILIAGETPIAVIYQDWLKATKGMMPRFVDLTSPGCNPRNGLALASTATVTSSEKSGFAQPSTITMSVTQGILSANVQYDIGFSYYNKLIDYETNVVFGCSVIPTSDRSSIEIPTWSGATEDSAWDLMFNGGLVEHLLPWEYSDSRPIAGVEGGRGFHINDYEIRFYYRVSGIGEWLPAGSFDAAKLWFFPFQNQGQEALICQQAVASVPGGQPNGFVDYSPLPKQRYICSVVFNQRAFWFSEKDFRFSLQDNIYAYPLRNVVSSQTGKWRGGIVHARKDEFRLEARIVVFGDNTYSGRFTGNKFVQNVRVSANEVGQFPVDGSDFVLDYLCDATAFSYRSAVVADGVLYFWGPQGVYRDDGTSGGPQKISDVLEPTIYEYVDMGRDDEIHCVFNKRVNEVVWFYPPKETDAEFPTYGLVFNIENNRFYPVKFRCQVDASQNIKLENDETPDGVDGERVLLHCRETTAATVQRTFYYDDVVEAGEQGPGRELTVITVATPATGQRRLTLAAGSIGVTAGNIEVNDYICVQNARGYAPALTDADDFIAKIVGVNNASSYIDIELPTGAAFDATASLTGQTAFPIYHRKRSAAGLHGITYNIQTNYWMPDGLSNSWVWQYMLFLFRYAGIPTPLDPLTLNYTNPQSLVSRINFAHRSLVCGGPSESVLSIVNNSSGYCQIHHPLRNVNRSANGQALAFTLSGIFIGDLWTLEYVEAHNMAEDGFTLKEFEG